MLPPVRSCCASAARCGQYTPPAARPGVDALVDSGHVREVFPLARYLAAQPGDRVTLTLAEIEAIVGAPLPAGARRRDWWTMHRRTGLRPAVWAAGWRVLLDGFWG